MRFSDIPAHEAVKNRLRTMADCRMRCCLKVRRVSASLRLQGLLPSIFIAKTARMGNLAGFVHRAGSMKHSIISIHISPIRFSVAQTQSAMIMQRSGGISSPEGCL